MKPKGQAIVETALLLPLLIGIFAATAEFARWFLIRQKLMIAARQAAWLYSSGRLQRGEVERLVRRYVARSRPGMDLNGLRVQMGRQPGWRGTLFRLDQIRVSYRMPAGVLRYFTSTMEETCVIRHAPQYGPPFQTVYGPAVPW